MSSFKFERPWTARYGKELLAKAAAGDSVTRAVQSTLWMRYLPQWDGYEQWLQGKDEKLVLRIRARAEKSGTFNPASVENIEELAEDPEIVYQSLLSLLCYNMRNFSSETPELVAAAMLRVAQGEKGKRLLMDAAVETTEAFVDLVGGGLAMMVSIVASVEDRGILFTRKFQYRRLLAPLLAVARQIPVPEGVDPDSSKWVIAQVQSMVDVAYDAMAVVGASDHRVRSYHAFVAAQPHVVGLCTKQVVDRLGVQASDFDRHGPAAVGLTAAMVQFRCWADHGLNDALVLKTMDRVNITKTIDLYDGLKEGFITSKSMRFVASHPELLDAREMDKVICQLSHWEASGCPDWDQFLALGATREAWQAEQLRLLEEETRREEEREVRLAAEREERLRRAEAAKKARLAQAREELERRHRKTGEKLEQEIDWQQVVMNVIGVLREHDLGGIDQNLAAAILVALMRSGDRLMPQSKWPKLKGNRLRREARRFQSDAQSRDVDSVVRTLIELRLLKQQGGKYFINTITPRYAGAAKVRSALINMVPKR